MYRLQIEHSLGFFPNKAQEFFPLIHIWYLLYIKSVLLEKLEVYFHSLKWLKITVNKANKANSIFDLTQAVKAI